MHKLRLRVVANIVVTEEGVLRDEMSQLVPLLLQWLLVEMESNTNRAIENEKHLIYFLLFVVDDVLILLVTEVPWLQSECNIVKELTILVCLRIEEKPEVVEYVIK